MVSSLTSVWHEERCAWDNQFFGAHNSAWTANFGVFFEKCHSLGDLGCDFWAGGGARLRKFESLPFSATILSWPEKNVFISPALSTTSSCAETTVATSSGTTKTAFDSTESSTTPYSASTSKSTPSA